MADDTATSALETEKRAMCLDRNAVLMVVSALRRYRSVSKQLLAARYSDGEVDGYSLHRFASEIEEVEEELANAD